MPVAVRLGGAMDISRFPEIELALGTVPPVGPVLIDLREATSIDSMTLSQLLLAKHRWQREGRRVALVVENPGVYRLMQTANVIKTLNVFRDLAAAQRFLSEPD